MMATQKALALMTGIATNVPMIAKTAKTTEMMNTAVVGVTDSSPALPLC